MEVIKVAKVRVNPRQSNLVVAVYQQHPDYKMREAGFTYRYQYRNPYKEVDDVLYRNFTYQMSPLLVSKLFLSDNKELVAPIMRKIENDPELRQWLLESKDKLHSIKCIKEQDMVVINAVIRDWDLEPNDFEPKLENHQLQALALYIVLGYGFNLGEMRTGKTPPTIIYAYASFLKQLENKEDGVDTIIVACPNSIKFNWLHELSKFTNRQVELLSTVVEGNKAKKIELWNSPTIFKIAGYSCIRADIEHVRKALEGKSYGLILDEVQRVKNPSKQTQAISSMIYGTNPPKFCFGLTGTFVANKPIDVARPCNMIVPNLLGKNYDDFVGSYCWTSSGSHGSFVTGYRHGALEEIHSRIARASIRALRKDVGQTFGKELSPMMLDMTSQQSKIHKDIQELLRAELMTTDGWTSIKINGFLPKLQKLTQVAGGFLYDQHGYAHWLDSNPKTKWIDQFLSDYLDNIKKVVIYSRFKAVLAMLAARYEKHGIVSVHGSVKPEDRTRLVDKFRFTDNTKIMLMNPSVAAGNDLNPAQFAIFYDRMYYLEPNDQAESRITGFNQKGDSTIIPLVCRESIDENLEFKVLPTKRKYAAIVHGDEEPTELSQGSASLTLDDLITLVG